MYLQSATTELISHESSKFSVKRHSTPPLILLILGGDVELV
jgi:hypothetical protein